MKNFITVVLLVLLVQVAAYSISTEPIPDQVVNYVKSHFPKAKSVHWQKHGNNYIAHFVNVKSEVSLCINEKGELLDRITEITVKSELPDSVKMHFKAEQLAYAEKFEGRNGEVFYILEIKFNGSEVEEYIYDQQGHIVKEILFEGDKWGNSQVDN